MTEPHEHGSCKERIKEFKRSPWDRHMYCCLCHPHTGCVLAGEPTQESGKSVDEKSAEPALERLERRLASGEVLTDGVHPDREPMVAVPLGWLTGLQGHVRYAEQAHQHSYGNEVSSLIGYCESVDAIIKYSERVQDV